MVGLVDTEAVLVEFEAFLVNDGRSSHGTAFLTHKLAELRAKHRVDETDEARVLRHFAAHLTDTFLGLLPFPATSDPLAADDRETSAAMDGGADIRSTKTEVPCQSNQNQPSPRAPGWTPAGAPFPKLAAPATIS